TSANQRFNYSCDRTGSPTYAAYFGCYAEVDAPSKFTGNVVVEGGDIAYITSDSFYTGAVPAAGGAKKWAAQNNGLSLNTWPGQGSGYGVKMNSGEYVAPGNGYYYQAQNSGRTYGTYRVPPESPPVWPTVTGATVVDGTITWKCVG